MSEHIPEAPPKPKGLSATLQKKVIGPVPLWLVIGVAGGVVLLLLRGRGGGASTPAPTDTGASGAPMDMTGANSGGATAGGAGSLDSGPTGNIGGFEDPGVAGSTDAFQWPDNSTGISPSPTPSDPIADPVTDLNGGWSLDPNVQAELLRIGTEYARTHPGWATNVSPGVGKGGVSKPGKSSGGWTLVSASGGGGKGGGYSQVGGGRSLSALVYPASSPSGRIAAATTPFSVSPSRTIVGVSSVAVAPKPVAGSPTQYRTSSGQILE